MNRKNLSVMKGRESVSAIPITYGLWIPRDNKAPREAPFITLKSLGLPETELCQDHLQCFSLSLDNTKVFGDGPPNFEPWSSDEDDTGAGTSFPNNPTPPMGGRLSSRQL
ncbi:hypothetical protein TNCV_1009971 [Trichonephila clavipes]|nr:hypothetical protein TNCV_1009971 [Trichonephila clavipes]